MGIATDRFIPGEYWTPERARDAVDRMTTVMNSPELQAVMREIADAAAGGGDSAEISAHMLAGDATIATPSQPVDPAACRYRRGRKEDIPHFTRLCIAGDLPPMFIEEFVQGFVAVRHGDDVVGCGGLEVYEDCGVIRSVVVDERARGHGVARHIAALLTDDARAASVRQLYLFTMQAYTFWRGLGFEDAPLELWKAPARASWQYTFISQHPEAATGVRSMSRSLAG